MMTLISSPAGALIPDSRARQLSVTRTLYTGQSLDFGGAAMPLVE
jgi:hypothetical protein